MLLYEYYTSKVYNVYEVMPFKMFSLTYWYNRIMPWILRIIFQSHYSYVILFVRSSFYQYYFILVLLMSCVILLSNCIVSLFGIFWTSSDVWLSWVHDTLRAILNAFACHCPSSQVKVSYLQHVSFAEKLNK